MARKKEYIEEEVIEKAMNLFWQNGYETTSMQMLEKEMGINKFSIYSSFGSKTGVFLESIKCYKEKLREITDKLQVSSNGSVGLKQYFYDFVEFSKETNIAKGCLITNTANELGEDADPKIQEELTKFINTIRSLFANNLKQNSTQDDATLIEQADYLIVAMFGLSSASRVFNTKQLNNYIENTFTNL
ncbi:TetR/AcrR family transcriptional regulator [Aquimarina aggregata]|uniref:TetR/AcrR family transcriptional regulator n=1 Tax=Aquimarina aggregata TaxID=1642818 RepID=UPI0024932E51|nr:TetR/AcrR family transcriptional regulator [Aquimarina aggregata]